MPATFHPGDRVRVALNTRARRDGWCELYNGAEGTVSPSTNRLTGRLFGRLLYVDLEWPEGRMTPSWLGPRTVLLDRDVLELIERGSDHDATTNGTG